MMDAAEGDDECVMTAEEELLQSARNGDVVKLTELLNRHKDENSDVTFDINCRGSQKANRGWTALHLAAYFGHSAVVQTLLENGADVSLITDTGDTPLHKAAYTGRRSVVLLLLEYNSDIYAINGEGYTAKHVAKTAELSDMLSAVENYYLQKVETDFLSAARSGAVDELESLLTQLSAPNINCVDVFGNTALHIAAFRDSKDIAVKLLEYGIDSALTNNKGLTALAMARSSQMKQLLAITPLKELISKPQRHEGRLSKKSRFLGHRPLWVILERGVLAYFKNRGDASTGSHRKGFKYLDSAKILFDENSTTEFTVRFSDGTAHRLMADSFDGTSVSRQKWMNALSEHISFSTHYTLETAVRLIDDDDSVEVLPVGSLQDALQTAQAHQQVFEKRAEQLEKFINAQSEAGDITTATLTNANGSQLREKFQGLVVSSRDTSLALGHCMLLFTQQEEARKAQLSEADEKTRVLQDALHALATEHHQLERSVSMHRSASRIYDTDDDEFYECEDEEENGDYRSLANDGFDDAISYMSSVSTASENMSNQSAFRNKLGRSSLPVPMFSRNEFSVWSILKQCIGKELSKITMPVIFNEPLSFLQRLAEYMEYGFLLDRASQCQDVVERMQWVAAFAVSSISSNLERIGKPFNPLLGETYELHKPSLGYRLISEQVSHHPPVSAFHVESENYIFHGAIHPKLKFWGKSVEVIPKGTVTLHLLKHNEVYTWHNVNCCVHNVVIGKLWVEHIGVMEIHNLNTRHRAVLNFKQGGWFGRDLHKVDGHILGPDKKKLKALYGSWVAGLYAVDVDTFETRVTSKPESATASPRHSKTNGSPAMNDSPRKSGSLQMSQDDLQPIDLTFDLNLPGQICLWRADSRPTSSPQYFNFTNFSLILNEMADDTSRNLAPTDARLRPDIRYLEEGQIDKAAAEKNRLEEKQRASRKDRKKHKQEWFPVWFHYDMNPYTGKEEWMFNNKYWERNWTECIEIF